MNIVDLCVCVCACGFFRFCSQHYNGSQFSMVRAFHSIAWNRTNIKRNYVGKLKLKPRDVLNKIDAVFPKYRKSKSSTPLQLPFQGSMWKSDLKL